MKQTLTLSGNEITDDDRLAARAWGTTQRGGSTDGAATPGGMVVWESGTNLFRYGQADAATDTNGAGGGAIGNSVDATVAAPFSPQSIKCTTDGAAANQGCQQTTATGLAAAAASIGVGSVYFKGVAGQAYTVGLQWVNTDATSTTGPTTAVVATGDWQLVVAPSLAVAAGKTGDRLIIYVRINGTRAESFWVAHTMLQAGVSVVSPYIATSGGVPATRPISRVQAPGSLLDPAQGWIALRLVVPWAQTVGGASATGYTLNFLEWNDGTLNNRIQIYYDGVLKTSRIVAGVNSQAGLSNTLGWAAGASVTIIAAWTPTTVSISFNGAPFQSAAASGVPAGMGTLFDIGNKDRGGGSSCDASIFWFACGTGTLTDADAATLAAIPNTSPPHAYIPSSAKLTGSFPDWGFSLIVPPTNIAD